MVCVNYNLLVQIVVSGESSAIDELLALLKERKVRAMKLPERAPFQREMMPPDADKLADAIEQVNLGGAMLARVYVCGC